MEARHGVLLHVKQMEKCVFLKSVTMTCEIDDDEDEEVKQGQGDFLDALRDLCGEAVTIS